MEKSEKIREHMEVVGSDGAHVGTVDRIEQNRIKLTKSDPASGGTHHYLDLDEVDHVEADKVCLKMSGGDARETWQAGAR
jgi:hypothetical protein